MLGGMSRRSLFQFAMVAAFWGASYLFIKVALEDVFSPPMIVFVRTALASIVLAPLALRTGRAAELRPLVGPIFLLGLIQVAAPFMLISYGEDHIHSSLAGILVAMAPVFTFLLSLVVGRDQHVHALGFAGVAMGIAGVVLLLGLDTGGDAAALVGGLMVVTAALGYAVGAYYLRHALPGLPPILVVTATMGASALMSAPLAALNLPTAAPSLDAVASLAALGVLGTGVAFVFFYDLIGTIGPARASLVAYVAPGFAVVYGVALLDEDFTVATLGGLVLILLGSYLAANERWPWQRRRVPVAAGQAAAVDTAS
jgi:drug/metabolite transporter (DMT)-like permease